MRSYFKTLLTWEVAGQFAKLAMIGVLNTAVYFSLINVLRTLGIELLARTTLAFATATLVSYLFNRKWTFQIKEGWASTRETATFFLINSVAWVMTAAVVLFADERWGPLTRLEENTANVVAAGFVLFPKFVSYRDVVFRSALRKEGRGPFTSSATEQDGSGPDSEGV